MNTVIWSLIALELFVAGLLTPIGEVSVSAYCDNAQLMYSGLPVHSGAAACGFKYPIGSIIVLDGRTVVRCLDRGGLVGDAFIDVWMEDCDVAIMFGRQKMRAWLVQ